MKLKITLLTIITHISLFCFAQLKIKDGGRVGIGTNDVSWYKTSISAPYGIMALNLKNSTTDWGYISRAQVTSKFTKAWVVSWNGADRFFVTGEGAAFFKNGWFYSDDNLKEDKEEIENPMELINSLHGLYYKYKPEEENDSTIGGTEVVSDEKRYLGLIAQDVAEVVPEVVIEDDRGVKAVAYQNLVALLIEGMKRQQQDIDDLIEVVSGCCGMSLRSGDQNDSAVVYSKRGAEKTSERSSNRLFQNVPNPFNQTTTIEYEIANTFDKAAIYVYNYQGEQLKAYLISSAGKGSINIKASEFKPGIYFYDLIVDNKATGTKKMILTQ